MIAVGFVAFCYSVSEHLDISFTSFLAPKLCSYPEIDTTTKRYTIAYYARTISYDIPNDIAQFLEKFVPLKDLLSFKPHKDAATHGTILEKLLPDGPKRGRGHSALSKCLNIAYRRDHGLLQDCEIEV
jgi:hypothetical protein